MPRSWGAGGRRGAGRGPRAAAEHRRDAAVERLVHQLRANEMDVRIDSAGGDDAVFSGDDLGPWPDHDVDPGLDVGIAGFADAADAAVADDLAAAELDLLAIDRAVALDLNDELGVGQPQSIARGRPEHCGIGAARDDGRHRPKSSCR